jgi:hypothetical protein
MFPAGRSCDEMKGCPAVADVVHLWGRDPAHGSVLFSNRGGGLVALGLR